MGEELSFQHQDPADSKLSGRQSQARASGLAGEGESQTRNCPLSGLSFSIFEVGNINQMVRKTPSNFKDCPSAVPERRICIQFGKNIAASVGVLGWLGEGRVPTPLGMRNSER